MFVQRTRAGIGCRPDAPLRGWPYDEEGANIERPVRPGLHCWLEAESASIVVHLEGEIDVGTAPVLADTIAAAFRQRRRVIVDLADVSFLDASGLAVLRRAAVQHIGRFAVAVSAARFRRLFDLARLAEVIPLAASVEAGLKYLTGAGQ